MGLYGLKSYSKSLLIVFFCVLFLFSFSFTVEASNSDEGYWKLVKVIRGPDTKAAQENNNRIEGLTCIREGHRDVTKHVERFVSDYESTCGHVKGKLVKYHHYDKNSKFHPDEWFVCIRAAGYIKWKQPPKKVKPGEKFDWKFEARLTENYENYGKSNQPGVGLAEVDMGYEQSYSVSEITSGCFRTDIGLQLASRDHTKPPLNKSVFEFPKKSIVSSKYIDLHVRTMVPVCYWSDRYVYKYEWVNAQPRNISANLILKVKHNYGGNVGDLKVKIKNLDTNRTLELTTDKNGQIKRQFKAKTVNDYVRIKIESCEMGPKTFYTIPMEGKKTSYIRNKIKYQIDKEIHVMDKEKEHSTKSTVDIPLIKATLLPFKWDYDKNEWVSCRAMILGGNKKYPRLFMAMNKNMKKGKDGSYFIKMYFPCSTILKTRRLSLIAYDPVDKIKDLKFFDINLSNRRAVNTIAFNLCDVCIRIARIRMEIREYLIPVVGEELATRIANVRVVLNPNAKNPNYLDGVITVCENFDLTSDQNCDTLTHEWGHRIMEILADDPGVEDRVGLSPHELWKVAPSDETAWDEGRVHFLGILLSKGLDLPSGMDDFFKKKIHIDPSKVTNAGDHVEGVITQGLINYYKGAGYTKTQEVLKDFINVQNYSKKILGHPPRTSTDFFTMKKRYIENLRQSGEINDTNAKAKMDELNRVINEFHITAK